MRYTIAFGLLALLVPACGGVAPPEDTGTEQSPVTTVCGASSSGGIQGRDVSFYQGDFDWNAQKAAGVVFGYARMGDGVGYADSQFAANWSKMKAAGILRGAYQYFEPDEDEVTQANLMIAAVGELGEGDLPAMIDVESTGGQPGATIAAKIANWLKLVEAGTGKPPIIYTGPYFWQDNVGSTAFSQTPLWTAHYGVSCPLIPPGWSNWTIWQYSDGDGSLDHDVFNGSLEDLQKLAAAPGPQYPIIVHRSAADINGDGQSDLCARASSGIVCKAGSTEVQGPAWSDASGWGAPRYYWTIRFADIDGDGKADLCARDAQGLVCERSTGAGFDGGELRGPAWSDANGWTLPEYYTTIQFGDINGDGKADVCARAIAGITCALSNGAGFDPSFDGPAWGDAANWNKPQYYHTIQFADVNGDGKDDLCARSSAGITCALSRGQSFGAELAGPAWSDANGWALPEYMETIRFADLDGDGKADVCGRAATGITCALSDGAGFPTAVQGPAWSDANGWAEPQYWSTVQTADVNGDGRADLCARSSAGVLCALFDGASFATQVDGPAWSSAGGWGAPRYGSTIGFADLDGDGQDDVCGRDSNGIQCALSTGDGFAAPTQREAWSDANGWGAEPYYATLRYVGVKRPVPTTPDAGAGSDASGWVEGGTPEPTPDAAVSHPPSNVGGAEDDGGGCGCVVGARGAPGAGWLALALAGLALRRRRATPSRRLIAVRAE
ncbi:MAG: GH25 family lysozyme [Sorangiineae bacterium]|nr:GH25 family lysozyme [Polyangiaceae bacterium]MEB2324584.1 GH25 family lysozyme [Sorangiineae bacterium]